MPSDLATASSICWNHLSIIRFYLNFERRRFRGIARTDGRFRLTGTSTGMSPTHRPLPVGKNSDCEEAAMSPYFPDRGARHGEAPRPHSAAAGIPRTSHSATAATRRRASRRTEFSGRLRPLLFWGLSGKMAPGTHRQLVAGFSVEGDPQIRQFVREQGEEKLIPGNRHYPEQPFEGFQVSGRVFAAVRFFR